MREVFDIEAVWAEQNVEKKKQMIIEAIDNFQYKKKAPLFKDKVNKSVSVKQLDNIALNIHMVGQGLTKI